VKDLTRLNKGKLIIVISDTVSRAYHDFNLMLHTIHVKGAKRFAKQN